MHATLPLLSNTTFPALIRRSVEVLQVNLGYRCNQSCLHCHVNAGPQRREEMTAETVDAVLAFISASPKSGRSTSPAARPSSIRTSGDWWSPAGSVGCG
jgi:hypothetical protein